MNCRKVQNLISAYVDCELPGVEMLAVRQHLNNCVECNSEYETLLTVKRAFGGLNSKTPTPGLADRIYFQLDQYSETPQEHFVSSVRKHLTFFPGRLRFAAATMGMFAVLLTLRSGQIYTNGYMFPVPQTDQVASLSQGDPGQLFPATSHVKGAHMFTPPPAPAEPWMISHDGGNTAQPSGGSMMMASYSVTR